MLRRPHRTTKLAVSADDNYTEPMLAYSDNDDENENEDETSLTSINNINESKPERISLFTNT